jgi:hypothetical protein
MQPSLIHGLVLLGVGGEDGPGLVLYCPEHFWLYGWSILRLLPRPSLVDADTISTITR